MQIESGVSLAGINPEIVLAMVIAEQVLLRYGLPCVVTSAVDGEHMHGSLHYVGAAVDLRRGEGGAEGRTSALAAALGPDYDVVLEKDHIHIEFQPKHGANPDGDSDD